MAISGAVSFLSKKRQLRTVPREHLEGSGGGQARARQHRGGDIGIKPGYRATQLDKTGGNAPDESGGGVDLPGVWLQPVQIHCAQGISCRLYTNLARSIGPNGSHGIQVDGSGQDTASLVVGMVAANFRSPGSGEKPVRPGGKRLPGSQRPALPGGQGLKSVDAFQSSWNYLLGATNARKFPPIIYRIFPKWKPLGSGILNRCSKEKISRFLLTRLSNCVRL